ncbi:VKORC1L1 [Bugula neritina]|uniref:vitamin-K-epoxide reductase (warfarin-sensitive) n=1 Tax=Bugula neritina TaxID=10212 RepID=A0A7J7JA21_BUGNE|nr:VKORC1L1 [Bugula neritina]
MAFNRKSSQIVFACIGILVSCYAYYVETTKEIDTSYVALCDINPSVSCSKVFTSKWGRGLGLLENIVGRHHVLNQPNSVFGIIYYIICIISEMTTSLMAVKLVVAASILSFASCLWLAYILFFVLNDVCVVCISMYVVNTTLLIGSIVRYSRVMAHQKNKENDLIFKYFAVFVVIICGAINSNTLITLM